MHSILVALNDSVSSRTLVDYLANLPIHPEDWHATLVHVFRKPSAGKELMGDKFMRQQPSKMLAMLEKAKTKLVDKGFDPDRIDVELIAENYPTVSDGIIELLKKRHFDMVIIGRKRMSKAEEFVLGDASVKLVRAVQGTAVLVVKSV
ncbi:MAG: universal stress protein [Desulfatiglans sp.]|jgi:nucleotide-binding universal stress UspA family protein|nr:universal stress protein [Thermodesulfobacteriota bacterium]MEE4351722.1 universal stress protein [Desulfatiglans sp.]